MANVYDEVVRLTKPRVESNVTTAPSILEALDGRSSNYDIDGDWRPNSHGHPRTSTKHAFGDDELLGGVRAIAYLAAMLPIGAPRRRRLAELHRKMTRRLEHPGLLIYGGHGASSELGRTTEALVIDRYLYFRPTLLRSEADLKACEALTELTWPGHPYPWSSYFPVWRVWTSPGFVAIVERLGDTPVPEGRWEIDPRASARPIVEATQRLHDLDEDAATLFLQLLTLVDCADAVLAEVNGWTTARHRSAAAQLVAKELLLDKKMPRSNHKYVLPGTWETLKAPNPAVETWKLFLYDAKMQGPHVVAPLGRLLPLRPVHTLFAEAFERHVAEAPIAKRRAARAPSKGVSREWLAEIRERPDDDELRLVYADWLIEHDDPRGELISLQIRRAEVERAPAPDAANLESLRTAEAALIARHRAEWIEPIHPFVKDVRFERGFVVGVTAHAPTFVKHATAIFDTAPLLTELSLDAGPVGPIPSVHWRQLGTCEHFERLTRLDTTSEHYIASLDDLELLLGGQRLPHLRWLRIGYHRSNDGLGLQGTTALADCERLSELRFLEYPGQNAGIRSVRALLESKHLTKLERLRVPFNGITDAQARGLAKALEGGLAPALRVLDFSNTVGTTEYITKAVSFHRNKVLDETASEIARTLGKR